MSAELHRVENKLPVEDRGVNTVHGGSLELSSVFLSSEIIHCGNTLHWIHFDAM